MGRTCGLTSSGFYAGWLNWQLSYQEPIEALHCVQCVLWSHVCAVVCSPAVSLKLKAMKEWGIDMHEFGLGILAAPKRENHLPVRGWLAHPMHPGCDVILFHWNTVCTLGDVTYSRAYRITMHTSVLQSLPLSPLNYIRLTTWLLLPPSQQGLCHP